ncbi:MAG: PD40 domain-containing protein [Acidobacteria bacterium]|nr:PD40 domain-containing protein [Acidobacteriota bacterium]
MNFLRHPVVVVALTVALAMVAIPAVRHLLEELPVPPEPPAALRAEWRAPADVTLGTGVEFPFGVTISPDGRRVAFPATRDGVSALWLQDLRTGDARELVGTGQAATPFWSADGARVFFVARGSLQQIDVTTGDVQAVMPASMPRGGSANIGGDIVIGGDEGAGLTLRLADGTVRALTSVDANATESAHVFPAFLPDGDRVIYFVRATAATRQGLWITSLSGAFQPTRLTNSAASAIVSGDRVIHAVDGALVARTLAPDAPELRGAADVLGARVGTTPIGELLATAAADVVLFQPPIVTARQLVWATRDGTRTSELGSPGDIWSARIAPDGRRVAATVLEPLLRTLDIVQYDGRALMPTRVSLSIDTDDTPAWSPDGRRIAWISAGRAVTVRGAGAVLPADTITRFDAAARLSDWTPDGRAVLVSATTGETKDDVWVVPVDGKGERRVAIQTPFNDVQATVSPDGRWIAYASDESGTWEIYVERFLDRAPGPGTRERVTSGGGSDPRWSRTGRELFFRRGFAIHVATPASGRGPNAAAATSMLFDTNAALRSFDVSPDGRRFLLNVPAESGPVEPATIVVNAFRW